MTAVIEFNQVSKGYHLGAYHNNLREAITQLPRKLIGKKNKTTDSDLFWSLKDVDFKIEPGEVVGLIGHNGAGKSTTLKLLSRVTYPTSGTIKTQGRMAALIELGAGFHPDLSGRENVYLNGSILGLKRREIDAALPQIVEFAELSQFIDTPVKRYSSGMYVRLAFAVAAHVRADLLLVDEVLSVGDASFQQKCLTKMKELRDGGATILFVSHNLWSVEVFCERVILLQKGQIAMEGKPHSVIEYYRRQEREAMLKKVVSDPGTENHASDKSKDDSVLITDVELMDESGKPITSLPSKNALKVRISYRSSQHIEEPGFALRIVRSDGLACCAMSNPIETVTPIHGEGSIEVTINPIQLVSDNYALEVRIVDRKQPLVYAVSTPALFQIEGKPGDADYSGVYKPNADWATEPVLE